jgi:RNA binding exosome subunit
MLNLTDVLQGIKNPDTKASLSSLKDVSPEAILKDFIQAYLIAQRNHNLTQEQAENPSFLNTIVKIDKQPVVLDENQGVVYQDDVITLRLRNVFNVERVAGFTETVKEVL